MPYDSVMPLLEIYLRNMKFLKGISTFKLVVELFIISLIWNQPKCLSINDWIKLNMYVLNDILLCHLK